MSEVCKVFLYGASGHARVVIDIIEKSADCEIAFMVDDNPNLKGEDFFGYPVVGGMSELLLLSEKLSGIICIGDNAIRMKIADLLSSSGFDFKTVVHPSAQIGRGVQLGTGTVVMAGAVINPAVVVGDHCIVNTGATVDHDCRLGNGVHIAPGATLCGTVECGELCFICAGSTIIPNLVIGAKVTVAAGATVIADIPNQCLALGTPARTLPR